MQPRALFEAIESGDRENLTVSVATSTPDCLAPWNEDLCGIGAIVDER